MSADHVCARCPRHFGRSCCEPGEGEQLATLTRADVERIEAETGVPARRFVEQEWLSHEEAWSYERLRPLYRGYFAQGPVRLTLQRGKSGACVFHQAGQGCSLSSEVRPLACRLYPFELLADGSWSLAVGKAQESSACLAVDEADTLEQLHALFGVEPEQLEAWADLLRSASREHGQWERR